MKIPEFVAEWCESCDLDICDFHENWPGCDWEKVDQSHVREDKYSNLNQIILRHIPSGRFVRIWDRSLPYGIDYEMECLGLDGNIEEVFPVELTVTNYLTREELNHGK